MAYLFIYVSLRSPRARTPTRAVTPFPVQPPAALTAMTSGTIWEAEVPQRAQTPSPTVWAEVGTCRAPQPTAASTPPRTYPITAAPAPCSPWAPRDPGRGSPRRGTGHPREAGAFWSGRLRLRSHPSLLLRLPPHAVLLHIC